MTEDVPIRDATSMILLREAPGGAQVLMGRRLSGAVFMPGKYVFPGGRVDDGDADVPVAGDLHPTCRQRLGWRDGGLAPEALLAAGIREVWEETGLILGEAGDWPEPPGDWQAFARAGRVPSANGLRFIFRAVTPPGRPRRFDARFFVASVGAVAGDPDDFSAASGELVDLAWIPLAETGALDLAIVTQEVLSLLPHYRPDAGPPASVTFMMRDRERTVIPPSAP